MRRADYSNDKLTSGTAERDEANAPGALTTRRALIAGAMAGLAGLVADSVISAQPAGAANGNAVLLGTQNSASATTEVDTTSGCGLKGITLDTSAGWSGVFGQGGTYGVYGEGASYGVFGTDTTLSAIAVGASIMNASNGSTALQAETAGTGSAVEATITNTANSSPAVSATTTGTGNAVEATIDNTANSSPAVSATTNGTDGVCLYGNATGDGGIGVEGTGVYGLFGLGGTAGVHGAGAGYGVYGAGGTYGLYGTDEGSLNNIAVAASLTNSSNASTALQAQTEGSGSAVDATIDNTANSSPAVSASTNGTNGVGVSGNATGTGSVGVSGTASSTGLQGTGDTCGVLGTGGTHGDYGVSTKAGGRGTTGRGTNGATGLYGLSDKGTGVLAKSTSGDALKVVGKVAFSRSGLVTVAAKKKSVKVTLAGVATSSMILATLQSDAGEVAVANAVAASGYFTINLTAAHSSSVKVAWFVIG
jgi:hypothetical protein